VPVALCIQHAMCVRLITSSSVACLNQPFFPHYLTNGRMFGKNIWNIKCVLWFLHNVSEIFLILRRIQWDIINVHAFVYTSFVRKVLRLSLQKIKNSTSQLMLPVPFEVVPSAVNTLLPAFMQVLKADGECLFRNACELHRRSRFNNLDILMSPSF
jgi:hypothetical protein